MNKPLDHLHPNIWKLAAAIYPHTLQGRIDRMLQSHTQLRHAQTDVVRQLIVGIAKRKIADAVFGDRYNQDLAMLCRAGQMKQLEPASGVPGWRVISAELQWGLLTYFTQAESQAIQDNWNSDLEVCRYSDASGDRTAFAWCMRQRWNPESHWLGMRVTVGSSLSVDEIRVFPPDFVLDPDPFSEM